MRCRQGGRTRIAAPRSRADRFLGRLDHHLPTLPDRVARRAFLDGQLAGWQRRYARFLASQGSSEPGSNGIDPPQAADFLLTITGLAARRLALAEPAGGEHD